MCEWLQALAMKEMAERIAALPPPMAAYAVSCLPETLVQTYLQTVSYPESSQVLSETLTSRYIQGTQRGSAEREAVVAHYMKDLTPEARAGMVALMPYKSRQA